MKIQFYFSDKSKKLFYTFTPNVINRLSINLFRSTRQKKDELKYSYKRKMKIQFYFSDKSKKLFYTFTPNVIFRLSINLFRSTRQKKDELKYTNHNTGFILHPSLYID
jgi:hypothetical protein